VKQLFPNEAGGYENVHRDVPKLARSPYAFGKTQTPVHLHGPGIATLHFRILAAGLVPFDQNDANATASQVNRQCEPHGASADHKDLSVRFAIGRRRAHLDRFPWFRRIRNVCLQQSSRIPANASAYIFARRSSMRGLRPCGAQ